MKLWLLLLVCLISRPLLPPSLFLPPPKRADVVPTGYIEMNRFHIGNQHHVIFQNNGTWRWYVDGKFDCMGHFDSNTR